MHAIEYVTFWFEGDPRITRSKRNALDAETIIVDPRRREDLVWTFRHDVRLRGN